MGRDVDPTVFMEQSVVTQLNACFFSSYKLSMATVAGNCFINAGVAYQLKLMGPAQTWANVYAITRALWEKKGSLCTECGCPPKECGCAWDETRECHEARKVGSVGTEEQLMPWAVLMGR